MSERELEVFRLHRESQNRFVYFLLGLTASAIAFAVHVTRGESLSVFSVILGLAVLMWGISFYAGCRFLQYVESSLFANHELLQVQGYKHPETRANPALIQAASEGIREGMSTQAKAMTKWARVQRHSLMVGAVLFMAWHVLNLLPTSTSNQSDQTTALKGEGNGLPLAE